jgi:hypothetical protein
MYFTVALPFASVVQTPRRRTESRAIDTGNEQIPFTVVQSYRSALPDEVIEGDDEFVINQLVSL